MLNPTVFFCAKFFFFLRHDMAWLGAILPTQLADLARGDLAWLRAFLSRRRTRGTSLAAQLDARHDTERQDTLLTWAARHGPRSCSLHSQ